MTKTACRYLFALWIGGLALMSPPALLADVTGSILGTVTDPSSAFVTGARIKATQVDQNLTFETISDRNGQFRFLALPIGRYKLEASSAGFRTFVQTDIVLAVDDQRRVDVELQVGATREEVTVTAASVAVETTNTQMGELITGTKMSKIPLNGRSYTDLLALQPGVVPIASSSYSSPAVSGNLNAGNFSVSGQREGANGFMVNGGYAQESASMGTAVVPNLDSIAEFRILTNNADAEYGNYGGGLVNVITKSGTNQYHGNLFEYLRNSSMDARNFFSQQRGILRRNEFGGTFGGPIRRDKVFFFGDYQGTRRTVGVDTGLVTIPSAANHNGDFSDVAKKLTGVVKGDYWANNLAQRLGYGVNVGEPYYSPGCTSTSLCVFPNAVIPQSAFAAPSKNLLKYIPLPNAGSFFTTSAYPSTLRDDKFSSRVDANTRFGMLSGYYFNDDFVLTNPFPQGGIPGFESSTNGRAQMANVGLTKSFGPATVNEIRLSFLRNVNFSNVPKGGLGVSLASQGFVVGSGTGDQYNGGIIPQGPEGVPKIGFSSFTIGTVQSGTVQFTNSYQIIENFSKVTGGHSLKFGGSAHLDRLIRSGVGTEFTTGYYAFNGNETGNDFADFLLGAPNQFEQTATEPMHTQGYYYGLYGQDSWRATSELTLNYGLRWEVTSPWWEVFGRTETLVQGLQSKIFPGSPLGWVFPGDPGIPKTISPVRHNNFAPRIGVAYAPNPKGDFWRKLLGGPGKTSIRASFGIYYIAFEDRYSYQIQGDAPFGNAYSSPVPPLFATPFIDRQNGHNQGVRFPIKFPARNVGVQNPDNTIDWSQFLPISGSPGWDINNRVPYTEHYSFSLQRQFGESTTASLSYVGTQGHRLLGALEANPGNPALCLSVSQPSQVMPGTPTCGPFGENGVYHPITGGVIDGTRYPFGPQFGSNALFSTVSSSSYNALEASLRHSFGPLELLAGYTFSKSLDNASSWGNNGASTGGEMVNFLNPKLSRALSAFDLTHNFVVSYSYELPFNKIGRANRLTRGWTITGITRFTTGLPVTIRENDDRSLLGTASAGGVGLLDVPDRNPGSLNITDPRLAGQATNTNPYFNTALFSKPVIGQLGNSSKRFFHGPGLNNWDIALMKELALTESVRLLFRGEFYNIFNHAQFGLPNGNILSSSFGYVTSANAPRIGQVSLKLMF